jgi:glucokinase
MSALAIGIDMGGTSIKVGTCERDTVIHRDASIRTADFRGPEALAGEIERRVRALKRRFPGVEAVGVGVPGFVDRNTGLVHELTNVAGWREYFLAKRLREGTGLPAIAENDANCMGIAEFYHGAGRGLRNFLAITLGTGVGGAVFIDGQLHRGSGFGAGEVGQCSIDYRGVPGPHGNTGALERYVGNRQVAARAAVLYRESGQARPREACRPVALAAAAADGDPVARQVWDEFTTRLACALCNAVWLLNPEAVIIGGGIAQAGDIIFKPLREKMNAQLARPFCENLLIIPAHFGNEAGMIGAASLALEVARGGT